MPPVHLALFRSLPDREGREGFLNCERASGVDRAFHFGAPDLPASHLASVIGAIAGMLPAFGGERGILSRAISTG